MEEIINQHRQLTKELMQENTQLREKTSKSLGEMLINTRNQPVKDVTLLIENKQEIEQLSKQLQLNTQQISKQIKQWSISIKKLEETMNDMKNIGEIGQQMETDMKEIDRAIRKLLLLNSSL